MGKSAVFLDRDGTLIEEVHYLQRREDIKLLPQAIKAVRHINRTGALTVVITNQSAVARGLLNEKELEQIHQALCDLFRQHGGQIEAFYYCPHHPTAGDRHYRQICSCRKPRPGLLLKAAEELDIDLDSSYLIGDRLDDIEAGHRAGCQSILVKTGYGADELRSLREDSSGKTQRNPRWPDYVADTVFQGVEWIQERSF